MHEAGLVGASLAGSAASVDGVERATGVEGGAGERILAYLRSRAPSPTRPRWHLRYPLVPLKTPRHSLRHPRKQILEAAPAVIQASLAAGLAALQEEWADFRAATAAYAPFAPTSIYAVPTLPDYARGIDMGIAEDMDMSPYPYTSASAIAGAGFYGSISRRRTRTRGMVYPYDPSSDASDEPDSESESDLDEENEHADGLQVPQHGRQGTSDSEDARVPGRWGLLTPEESVHGWLGLTGSDAGSGSTPTAASTLFKGAGHAVERKTRTGAQDAARWGCGRRGNDCRGRVVGGVRRSSLPHLSLGALCVTHEVMPFTTPSR
ncbi:hypothetical protein DFH06DRAFT_607840 [Mycena polygramma]|nr:hypothetical protein DFH06DRAFT_607840 [Mycena polygramma]